jgi:hypothetical protein
MSCNLDIWATVGTIREMQDPENSPHNTENSTTTPNDLAGNHSAKTNSPASRVDQYSTLYLPT